MVITLVNQYIIFRRHRIPLNRLFKFKNCSASLGDKQYQFNQVQL